MANEVANYVDYFRKLAIAHQQLKHNPDSETGDAPVGSKRFTKVSVDDILRNVRSKVGFPCLHLELYEITTSGEIVYETRFNPKGAFMVLDHPAGPELQDELTCYETTAQIITDILKQIWQDHYGPVAVEDRCATPFKEFCFEKLDIIPVGPLFDKEFGWRVEFEFQLHNSINLMKAPDAGVFVFPAP